MKDSEELNNESQITVLLFYKARYHKELQIYNIIPLRKLIILLKKTIN